MVYCDIFYDCSGGIFCHFDLIIMGTHGHGELEELMVGSTASGVILKSKVPVLVARPS